MDGSMNNINLANDGYEENQFNAQLVDNLNIDDFQEFIGKNQEDTGMAIENNNFSLYDSSDIKDRMQNCARKCNQFGIKKFGDLWDNGVTNVGQTLEW